MIKKYTRLWLLVLALALTVLPVQVMAATELDSPYTNLSASITGSTTLGSNSYSGSSSEGAVSMKVTSGLSGSDNGTLTLTNSGSETAVLSFSYTVSGTYDSCTIAGNAVSGSGTYSVELISGGSIDIAMTVPKRYKTGTVELTNVALKVAGAANVTLSHNGLGTISIGGTTVSSGTTVEVAAEGTTLAATPASGATFLGWVNTTDNSVYSTSASLNYVPTGDISLKAIFASTDNEAAFWGSGKSYLFESLGDAIAHASSASNKTIILAEDGTLSAGDYTIPSGVTLLIPFDSAGTCYTTAPGFVEDSWSKPSTFYTLTMSSGANITVNGAISVSAKVSAKMGFAGAPTSSYGHIAMNSGSTITVNSGGNLYAWGYITGSGSVTIKNGGTVYESFQVVDWRGGTASSGMLNNSNKVFPMSQYYVQNVEVLMTYETGAKEHCSMVADIISVRQVVVNFVGSSGCLFNLTSGTATKQYDGNTDRLLFNINGDFSVSNTEIPLVLAYKITIGNYVLPVSNYITLNVNSGSLNFATSTSLLPGAQINIAEGATVTLGSGAKLFVYDEDDWKKEYYVYSNAYFRPVRYAHSQGYTRTNSDIIDAQIVVNGTLDASAGYLYTTSGGGNICSTGNGIVKLQSAEANPTLYEATQSGTSINYSAIPVSAAQLTNADGSKRTTGADTYTYSGGVWNCTNHSYDEGVETTAPTCTEEGVKTFTCVACGNTKTEAIAATGHTEAEAVTENNVDATCTIAGSYESVIYCSVCSEEISRTKVTVDALGHQPGAEATCATAQVCTREGCGATLAEATGAHSYTVEVEGSRTAATCMATGSVTMKCANCSATEVQTLAIDQDNHTGNDHIENAKDATCTEAGYTGDTVCECGVTVKTGEAIPAKNHNYGETSYTWADDGKSCTAKRTCANDASHVEEAAATITSKITTPASCTAMGTTTYTATFDVEWAATQSKDVQDVPVIDHTYDQQNTDDTFKQSDATCTAKATYYYSCSCGAKGTETFEYGDAKGHSYADPVVTFSDDGTTYTVTVICGDCVEGTEGHTKTSETWDSTVSGTTAGDCQTNSSTTYSASGDFESVSYSDTKTVDGEKGDHSYDSGVVTEPTCEEGGYTTYTCQVAGCSHSYTANETPAKNHSWTVSYEWSEDGKSCTATRACGNDPAHNETEMVTATDSEKTAATCEAMGWTTYTADFGAEWAETQTKDVQDVAKLDHAYTGEIKSDGNGQTATHSYKCVNGCNEYGAAVKHTWNEGEQTKNPACEAAGEMTYTCTAEGCGATYTEEIAANGHVNTTSKTEQNTDGKTHTTTVTCACDHVVSTTTENCIDSNNDFACDTCGGLLVNAYTDAVTLAEEHTGTRTVEGATVTLKVTGNVAFAQAQGTGAWNHWVGFKITSPVDMSKVTILRPDNATRVMADIKDGDDYAYLYWGMTNDADKQAEYKIDWNGDGTYDLTVILDASGANLLECVHSWQDGEVTTPASCTTDGEMTYTCANCGKTKTEVIQATGNHSDSETDSDHICDTCNLVMSECSGGTATCEKKAVCTTCGAEYGELAEHTPGEAVEENRVESTCTVAGSYDSVVKCSVCGEELSRETKALELAAHVYDKEVATETYLNTAATCKDKATYFKSCTCGAKGTETFESGDVNPNNHVNTQAHTQTDATCTEAGYTAGTYCEDCNTWTGGHEKINALGHSYDEGVVTTEPTCTAAGVKTFTCENDATHTYTEVVAATGHSYSTKWSKDDTSHWCECSCGATSEMAAHTYGAWVVDKPATTTEVGSKYKTCSGCGYVVTAEIPVVEVELDPVINKTGSTTPAEVVVTTNDGKWKLGENTFTVSCDMACVVAYTEDGGESYQRIDAISVGTNVYSFSVELTSEKKIVICFAGDANSDSVIDVTDAVRIKAFLLDRVVLDGLQLVMGDANGDKALDVTDAVKIKAMLLDRTTTTWN